MAEVTAMRNNALPYPMYGLAWTLTFPFLDADGDTVTGATTPDAEVSLNGDTPADCTNESTEIGSTGVYYLTLTAAEMTADIVTVFAKSATAGMKTTVATLYPRKLVPFKASATSAAGAAGTITFDSGASTIDDFYNGMVIVATLDSAVETRIITDYVGSTKVASVVPNWNTTPDSDDTFIVYLTPEMSMYAKADVLAWNSAAVASPHTAGYPAVTIKDGTGTGEIDTTSGGVLVAAIAANAITATAINADAITAAKIADGAIDAATFAAGAITATAIAADAIGASELAADAIAEIADAVWDEDATGHQTGGTFGQAIGDPGADTTTMYAAVVTGAAGTHIAADIIAIKAETAAILVDTGTTLDGKIDTISTNVDAILVDTAEIGAAGAGLTAINLPNQTMDIVGNITGNLSGSVGSVTGAVGSVTGAVGSVTGAVGSVTGNVGGTINGLTAVALKDFFDTDSATTYASAVAGSVVKEIADNAGGASLTVADIVDGVWSEALPGAFGAGEAGKIVGDNLNATVGSRATQTSVDDLPTNAELATALGTADDAVLTAIDALPTAIENADALLDRDMSTGADNGSTTVRTVRQALRFSRNKWAISGGTLTVYKEDDSTSSWSSTVGTAAGDPVTSSDPAGP